MLTEDVERWLEKHRDELAEDIAKLVRIPSVSAEDGMTGERCGRTAESAVGECCERIAESAVGVGGENAEETAEEGAAPFGEACARVLEQAERMAGKWGFVCRNEENYCTSFLWPGETAEEIGIFAHLDVVPAGEGWSFPPFSGIIRDRCVYGRGAGDNKGPGTAAFYALCCLKELGWKPRHSIRMFWGVNEETGMKDIEYYLARHQAPAFSLVPDSVFPVCVGEKGKVEIEAVYDLGKCGILEYEAGISGNSVPAVASVVLAGDCDRLFHGLEAVSRRYGMTVEPEARGLRVTARGTASHAAMPARADNAQVKLAKGLLESGVLDEAAAAYFCTVVDLFGDCFGQGLGIAAEDEIFGRLTHVGGRAFLRNGEVIQHIDIRYGMGTEYAQISDHAVRTLDSHGYRILHISDDPPHYFYREHPVIKAVSQISSRVLGRPMEPAVIGGGTYARKLKQAVGCGPGVPWIKSVYGPGRGRGHQPDEYVELDRMEACFRVYVEVLETVDKMI